MRTLALVALAGLLAVAMPAAAHSAGPCDDSGEPGNSDYAQHHITPLAQDGDMGQTDHDGDGVSHTPGAHQGYSACDPAAN